MCGETPGAANCRDMLADVSLRFNGGFERIANRRRVATARFGEARGIDRETDERSLRDVNLCVWIPGIEMPG